jgi:multidrug efflux pump subunit AcrB
MTCPKCGSCEVRTSKSARWSDIFQRVRGREAFRCRKCRQRFFASISTGYVVPVAEHVVQSTRTHRPTKHISTRRKQRLVKRLVVILIFAVAFILFLFFLRYLTTERMPPSDSETTFSHVTSSQA